MAILNLRFPASLLLIHQIRQVSIERKHPEMSRRSTVAATVLIIPVILGVVGCQDDQPVPEIIPEQVLGLDEYRVPMRNESYVEDPKQAIGRIYFKRIKSGEKVGCESANADDYELVPGPTVELTMKCYHAISESNEAKEIANGAFEKKVNLAGALLKNVFAGAVDEGELWITRIVREQSAGLPKHIVKSCISDEVRSLLPQARHDICRVYAVGHATHYATTTAHYSRSENSFSFDSEEVFPEVVSFKGETYHATTNYRLQDTVVLELSDESSALAPEGAALAIVDPDPLFLQKAAARGAFDEGSGGMAGEPAGSEDSDG